MTISLTPVAKNIPSAVAVETVSQDVKDAFTESWNYVQANPGFDMQAVFTTREERNQFITQLTGYAVSQGVYVRQVRGSGKDKTSTVVKWSMEDNTVRLARLAELKTYTDALETVRVALASKGVTVASKAKGSSIVKLANEHKVTVPDALKK